MSRMTDELLALDDAARKAAEAKARRAARKAARAAIPPPERDHAYDHLGLDELRTLRGALGDEETRVAYWTRIIRQRLDAVRSGGAGREPVADLTGVLHEADRTIDRLGAIDVPPVDDLSPLPDLAELWARPVDAADDAAVAALEADLAEAVEELDDYRAEIQRRTETVTRELIARYREEPLLALQTLPTDPLHRTSIA
ncbi:MAG: hypothetical protein LCI03_10050 [Actinobacteria bacterium]|nr:hypothetical protein [Actinomycetota bacterium]